MTHEHKREHGHEATHDHDQAQDHEHAHDHEHSDGHEHGHDHEHEHAHGHGDEHSHDHTHTHAPVDPDTELQQFRTAKDEYMRGPTSPLPEEERSSFTGLSFYPPNPALRLELALDPDVSREPVTMETSTGGEQEYHRAGKVHFEVEGQPAELTLYSAGGQLFVPMRDATSSTETYPAGRYLEPGPAGEGRVFVDFNYLYNPFCAYSEHWSCPIPPVENWLRVPIEAGEKRFNKE